MPSGIPSNLHLHLIVLPRRDHLRDSDIRATLHASLLEQYGADPNTLIRHEVGLCAGERRIDVVLVNGELAGYEIKSDEDTLNRLAGQAETYGRVLDRAILVTTQRHLSHALDALPAWWGVMEAHPKRGDVHLRTVRKPALNDQHDAFSLVQLLWRDEVLAELSLRGKSKGLRKKARHYLWTALADAVPLDELRAVVRTGLKARPEWPGGELRVPHDVTPHKTATE